MFVLLTVPSFTQALKEWKNITWKNNPANAWPYTDHQLEHKVVLLLLNIPDYLGNGREWKFIASGVLLDNSRILTSYNPFKQLIRDPNITDNILALLSTGSYNKMKQLKIANIVCGRQIAYVRDDKNDIWRDKEHSPIHDLMVIRIEEEIGIASASYRQPPLASPDFLKSGTWQWTGQLQDKFNCLISMPASIADTIDPEVHIFTLGYMSKKQMQDFDTIHEIILEANDAALVDCDEWLPRQWGFFICIRNIGNFPGLGSGATLVSKNKLFGIGSFAMFKNDVGILVFTDVRRYGELIQKTCGDEEF